MVSAQKDKWICCQIGAREHYAIPYELFRKNELQLLMTDYWAGNDFTIASRISKNLRGRKHAELPDDFVRGLNFSMLTFELLSKLHGLQGWEKVMTRNQWFQKKVIRHLSSLLDKPTHLFSYSYAAHDIFGFAKRSGWKTVLGQIDPGTVEENIVTEEVKRYPQYKSEWKPAPKEYWENWHRECDLADRIVVNSDWSLQALIKNGIPPHKIEVAPLTFAAPLEAISFQRKYPHEFSKARPLRVLFLGQVILRKGIGRLIEAAEQMQNRPIEFIVVGPIGIDPLPQLKNIKWLGRIPRLETHDYFRKSDVFLLPTLSDGYALTQLEAFAWQLPVISTPFCGAAVQHLQNGYVMTDATPQEITKILEELISNPQKLFQWSENIKR